jgi:hypothetical protein
MTAWFATPGEMVELLLELGYLGAKQKEVFGPLRGNRICFCGLIYCLDAFAL